MSGIGDCWLPPPGLGVEHRWRMHTLWMNQELWSNKLLHTQQDLWEENRGHCWSETAPPPLGSLVPMPVD